MPHALRPCSECQRHVRVGADECPFCGASLPGVRLPPLPPPGLSRSGQLLWAMLIGSGVTGCAPTTESSKPPTTSTSEPKPALSQHAGWATEADAAPARSRARAPEHIEPDVPRHPVAIYGGPTTPTVMPINGFRAGSAKLEPPLFEYVDEVAGFLRDQPEWRVVVEGHADPKEARRALELAERRAAAVRDYLIAKGIVRERMIVKGFVDREPASGSIDELQRSRNRRVIFRRIERDGGVD